MIYDKNILTDIVNSLIKLPKLTEESVLKVTFAHPDSNGKILRKSTVINFIRTNYKDLGLTENQKKTLLDSLRIKKTRTISGVTPVTVLTKPYPCPGQCIFCPSDVRMPKSYISDEPGAQRAFANDFDPYLQTFNRLIAFNNNGHSVDKVELIILGGTWSVYPEDYQIWFVKRCFDALNDFIPGISKVINPPVHTTTKEQDLAFISAKESYNKEVMKTLQDSTNQHATWSELEKAQNFNETANSRCVGLVVETRPDVLTVSEALRMRHLGATKVQIGIQSLDNRVLKMNKRGHDIETTKKAMETLRMAGFKIHAHWMPNLYGATPDKDIKDYKKLFSKNYRPDELKVYPCSLIKGTELVDKYNKKLWKPYTMKELLYVAVSALPRTPRYCRLTRIFRDIPSQHIKAGNKKTNFRQLVDTELAKKGLYMNDIRAREVKDDHVDVDKLVLRKTTYKTSVSTEIFLEYTTPNDKIVGFLRLSLPIKPALTQELDGCSLIREVHVYGPSLNIGNYDPDHPQHFGIGTKLISLAKDISIKKGYKKIAVISSIGTREYYKKFNFKLEGLYQICYLVNADRNEFIIDTATLKKTALKKV